MYATQPSHRTRVHASRLGAALAALAFAYVTASAAELYRWVDEQGGVHLSDRPPDVMPPGGYQGPHPPTIGEVLEQERVDERERRAAERRRRLEDAEREAALAASAPKGKVHSSYDCEQARGFVESYSRARQELFTREPDGSFRRSTPEEISATLAQWREAAEILCQEGVEIVRKPAQ
jgi:hypothetical protein